MQQYTVRLDEEILEALQNMAVATGVPAAEIARNGIEKEIGAFAHRVLDDLKAETKKREQAAESALATVKSRMPALLDSD